MKKFLIQLLLLLFPTLLMAADDSGSLTFTPPSTDVSVAFLSNIFGVVDGVLHGTGSQIMGEMFAVFNSAVLALGGIIIMYTLMVSTMNTAHEGQMLGQKWSSIWVPVRSTLGLTLLIPKASGYCLMQIFFMWVVVQGVGAGDKVWDAALSYLNRGGVIVQQQINPIQMFTGSGEPVTYGAANMLYGQVCMLGLEAILKNQRKYYLDSTDELASCEKAPKNGIISKLCDNPVPDLLSTVNIINFQKNAEDAAETASALSNTQDKSTVVLYQMPMPDFDSDPAYKTSPYKFLTGFCGKIAWNSIDKGKLAMQSTTLNSSEMETVSKARATALQQMFMNLSTIAQIMINNNPQLNTTASNQNAKTIPGAPWAKSQFGVPLTETGAICPPGKYGVTASCDSWGPAGDSTTSPLFNGVEFKSAITDYHAIMLPTLTLFNQFNMIKGEGDSRYFIKEARSKGWMLAGSYFFYLSNLSAKNTTVFTGNTQAVPTDSNTGLEMSNFAVEKLDDQAFQGNACRGDYSTLCEWLDNDPTQIKRLQNMIRGDSANTVKEFIVPVSNQTNTTPTIEAVQSAAKSSTVFGFVNNSLMMTIPGQPSVAAPEFKMDLPANFTAKGFVLPDTDFGCEGFWCIASLFASALYNSFTKLILQVFIDAVFTVLNTVMMAFLALPLLGIAEIFKKSVAFIQDVDANPIVALANMGINYINFASDLWMYLAGIAIAQFFLPVFGLFIIGLMMMALPLLMAWLGVMLGIGYLTAYYVPFVPYMIFTFGSIAWLMAVVEAMVAAPIVALSITHPEGEGPFGGKAEQSLMILMNVFLRPSLMIIGYIAGIILSYVSVWVINAGFTKVLPFMQGKDSWSGPTDEQLKERYLGSGKSFGSGESRALSQIAGTAAPEQPRASAPPSSSVKANYSGWSAIYGFFFAVLIYTSLYLTVVQKAFTLISVLPDKVLRWIGGQPESIGQEAAQWQEEPKKQMEAGAKATEKAGASGQLGKDMGSKTVEGADKLRKRGEGAGGSMKGGT